MHEYDYERRRVKAKFYFFIFFSDKMSVAVCVGQSIHIDFLQNKSGKLNIPTSSK